MESSIFSASGSCGWLVLWIEGTGFSGPKMESCVSMLMDYQGGETMTTIIL